MFARNKTIFYFSFISYCASRLSRFRHVLHSKQHHQPVSCRAALCGIQPPTAVGKSGTLWSAFQHFSLICVHNSTDALCFKEPSTVTELTIFISAFTVHLNNCLLNTVGWSAWLSGRTSVFGQRSFAILRSTCSWRVTTYVGKPSAIGQTTRPTQPFIL